MIVRRQIVQKFTFIEKQKLLVSPANEALTLTFSIKFIQVYINTEKLIYLALSTQYRKHDI